MADAGPAETDLRFMGRALELAREAGERDEVPVGALVVRDGEVLGEGRNGSIEACDPTAHAEVLALRRAAATARNYRLAGATLYCTVEPCLMCLGAALHARIDRLVFAADDPKIGATSRLAGLCQSGAMFNHRIEIVGGVLADTASLLLLEFFRQRRGPAADV